MSARVVSVHSCKLAIATPLLFIADRLSVRLIVHICIRAATNVGFNNPDIRMP